jgi:hypothetical protein
VQREPLVDSNDDTRRLVYTAIDCVLGATHYSAAVQVFADASGGSRLVWLIDFLPYDIAQARVATLPADITQRGGVRCRP